MSSTNKTTNYDLSQFIGTDKPAWLTDYNADMGKIDTGINTAQGTATGADTKATANASAIGTISNLTTEAKSNLVAAINEVDTNADAAAGVAATATQTANNSYTIASGAKSETDALADYLTLSSINTYNHTVMTTNNGTIDGSNNRSSITIAKNSTASLGKVYGRIWAVAKTPGGCLLTINTDCGIHPESDLTIANAGIASAITPPNLTGAGVAQVTMVIKPTGKIEFQFTANHATAYNVILFPFVYFFTDFGDVTPEE